MNNKQNDPDEWIKEYVSDWYFWNGVAYITIGVVGFILLIVAVLTSK